MNERINNLRLDAGISQLKDDPRLVVIDRQGNVIDPLIGLEKFAELIVRECMDVVDPGVNQVIARFQARQWLSEHFGVKS